MIRQPNWEPANASPATANEWKELAIFAEVVRRLLSRLQVDGRLELADMLVLVDGRLTKAPYGDENWVPPQLTEAAVAASCM